MGELFSNMNCLRLIPAFSVALRPMRVPNPAAGMITDTFMEDYVRSRNDETRAQILEPTSYTRSTSGISQFSRERAGVTRHPWCMSTIGPLLAIQLLLSSSQAVPNSETKLRTTVPLVVLPTSVTDGRGRSITGLEASDFTVLENGKAKTIHVDPRGLGAPPIFLVLTIQMSGMNSGVLSKLQKMGGLIAEGVVG